MTKTVSTFALAAIAALILTGCVAAPRIGGYGLGDVDEMRADLKACTWETVAFEFIPDFGITSDLHRNKCMKQRGWAATPRQGVYDYSRFPESSGQFHPTTARAPLPDPPSDTPTGEFSPRPDWCTAENLIWRGDHCEVRPPK